MPRGAGEGVHREDLLKQEGRNADGREVHVATGRSGAASVVDAVAWRKLDGVPVGEGRWDVVIR